MTAEALLSRLEGVHQTGRGRWRARCPAHGSKSATLAISEGDGGRVLLKCFGGCEVTDVLEVCGIGFDVLFPERDPSAHHVRGERRPFDARQVLAAIADEAIIAATLASDASRGNLDEAGRLRLFEAAGRLAAASEMAGSA